MERRDNYQIQAQQAKQCFLRYDQQEIIARCQLRYDDAYLYTTFLHQNYRICRKSGNMQRQQGDAWIDGNSFGEVMTLLDWLCDSKPHRFLSGQWVNAHGFHRNLQEKEDGNALFFDAHPEAFEKACRALGGVKREGGDISYTIELMDGFSVWLRLWHGDEEFPPQLSCLWDKNMTMYIRYETSWYVLGLLMQRLREAMEDVQ